MTKLIRKPVFKFSGGGRVLKFAGGGGVFGEILRKISTIIMEGKDALGSERATKLVMELKKIAKNPTVAKLKSFRTNVSSEIKAAEEATNSSKQVKGAASNTVGSRRLGVRALAQQLQQNKPKQTKSNKAATKTGTPSAANTELKAQQTAQKPAEKPEQNTPLTTETETAASEANDIGAGQSTPMQQNNQNAGNLNGTTNLLNNRGGTTNTLQNTGLNSGQNAGLNSGQNSGLQLNNTNKRETSSGIKVKRNITGDIVELEDGRTGTISKSGKFTEKKLTEPTKRSWNPLNWSTKAKIGSGIGLLVGSSAISTANNMQELGGDWFTGLGVGIKNSWPWRLTRGLINGMGNIQGAQSASQQYLEEHPTEKKTELKKEEPEHFTSYERTDTTPQNGGYVVHWENVRNN